MSYWLIDSGITSKEGKKCPKCGTLIHKDVNECPKCAKKIQEKNLLENTPKGEIECPNCKTLIAKDIVTCTSCGINFIDYLQSKSLDMAVLHSAKKNKK
ncbi:MAG: hypothetical protein EAX90_03695 [Candidatus Heimdallarchaeota archaeon]|nr:hypothetical protein [Candidatus Heimdallarchaeota archaeon]